MEVRVGACHTCGEAIHYRYPCKCLREAKPVIVTLCGSTRFKKEFEEENASLTLSGCLVISVGVFGHSDGVDLTDKEKQRLDFIHLRKIDLADEIRVINVGGYIGSSTRKEIEYAIKSGKLVTYKEVAEPGEE